MVDKIWVDPVSVCIVFGSGPYKIVVGWILAVKTLRLLYGMKERNLILVMKYGMSLLALPTYMFRFIVACLAEIAKRVALATVDALD